MNSKGTHSVLSVLKCKMEGLKTENDTLRDVNDEHTRKLTVSNETISRVGIS